jgi:hypothetical protein
VYEGTVDEDDGSVDEDMVEGGCDLFIETFFCNIFVNVWNVSSIVIVR